MENFIDKEVVLTIRVPKDFDREDERMLDDEFSAILEKQGWELVDSKEYRDVPEQSLLPVNRVTITRERYSERESWSDNFWVDASKTPSVELFKAAVEDYLKTPDGIAAIEATSQDFNWGDAIIYVPEETWREHGIFPFDFNQTPQEMGLSPTSSDNVYSFIVNQDEILIPDYDQPSITFAKDLPEGWQWHKFRDGSGSLNAPDGTSHFIYDLAPYSHQGGIEYQKTAGASYDVFWGSFDKFIAHAENHISQDLLRSSLSLGEHHIPSIMQELADNAWYGKQPQTACITAGNHVIQMRGYTYEPIYEDFSATASITLDGKILYGLDSRNIAAYRNEVYQAGIYDRLEDAISHIKENTKGLDYILCADKQPSFDEIIKKAETRTVGQPSALRAEAPDREH